jgi:zinc protease
MKLRKIWAAMLLLAGMTAQAQELPTIPVDPEVRTGKLDNGLTYYIRHNGYPEKVASFYIAQRVGSVQENDDQRGLAHLLEHMAFNGTDHFKDNALQEYLQSIGVEYGRNLNAYTSTDQTVYYITDVPTARISALDSCMLILKDWSNGITLSEEAINAERDIVHNEYRMRIVGTQKILESKLPALYPGSKYGERFPIGLMEVIDKCNPETLRAYYRKWYRPDNQGIIIVGDIDVDRTEAKVKELFAGIKVPANAAKVEPVPVPDNNEGIYLIGTDKEQQVPLFLIAMKHDVFPDSLKNTMAYMIKDYMNDVFSHMINARFTEETQKPDCPILQASVSDGTFLVSRTKDALMLTLMPKEGQEIEAVKTALRELKRVKDHGFTATEYERAKSEYVSQLEKVYNNREKYKTNDYCEQYVSNFINSEPIPSIEYEYTTMNQIVPMLPVALVNQYAQELICNTDTNFVALALLQEKEGKTYFTTDDIKKAVSGVRAEQLEAYVDNVKQEPLMSELPKKGSIVKETENKVLGYKEWTLSNGAKVQLKKTDFNAEEIIMGASSDGGESIFGKEDNQNIQFASMILSQSALGSFMQTDLQKALAGKQVSVSCDISGNTHGVGANSTPKDLETMMQLLYLSFTNIQKDEKAVNNFLNAISLQLKNASLNNTLVFQDSVASTVYGNNPRFRIPTPEQIESISYDRVLEIAKILYGNAANFTFTFCGNFDEAKLREYVEQYIASLPSKGKADLKSKEERTLVNGKKTNHFEKQMENPQAQVNEIWRSNPVKYTLQNIVINDMATRMLDMTFNREIREKLSAAYHAGAEGELDTGGPAIYMTITGNAMLNPDKVKDAVPEFDKGMQATIANPNLEDLNKVKQILLKQADVDAKTNRYWIRVLNRFNRYGVDIHTDYKKTVEAVTAKAISDHLKNTILKSGNHIEVLMMPKK